MSNNNNETAGTLPLFQGDEINDGARRSNRKRVVAISSAAAILLVACAVVALVAVKSNNNEDDVAASQDLPEVAPRRSLGANINDVDKEEVATLDAVSERGGRGGGSNSDGGSSGSNEDVSSSSSSATPLPTSLPPGQGSSTVGEAPLHAAGRNRKRDGDCFLVKLRRGAGNRRNIRRIREILSDGETSLNDQRDFSSTLEGFSLCGVNQRMLRRIQQHPMVDFVEEDSVVTASVEWGQDRIDQFDLPLDGIYNPNGVRGEGVDVYVVDTGIRSTHTDLGGRVIGGASFVGGTYEDCDGHGTHVAGTIGGTVYGVAPGVSLFAVRVLDCSGSGTTSGVVSGLDWVGANLRAGRKAVVNLSLGGGASSALDNAVRSLVAAGVTVVVAAGNDGVDACNSSPARVAEALTIGATSSTDALASWSNRGSCVDLLAPGVNIKSLGITSDTATATMSGTSMASPHAAGAVALYLSARPTATPQQAMADIVAAAVANTITSVPAGTVNKMLYITPFVSSGVPPATTTTTPAATTTAATAAATTAATAAATTTARTNTGTTRAATTTTSRATTTPRTTTSRATTTPRTTTSRAATTTRRTTTRATTTTAATTTRATTAPTTTAAAGVCQGTLCESATIANRMSNFHPYPSSGGYYCTANTGSVTHRAIIKPGSDAVANADLDLYLWRWDAVQGVWMEMDASTTYSSSEEIIFSATGGGCWSWEVFSYMGTGSYVLDMTIPA